MGRGAYKRVRICGRIMRGELRGASLWLTCPWGHGGWAVCMVWHEIGLGTRMGCGRWELEDIPDDRDHVELPEDYLIQAQEKYKFQASHPVDEGLRGGHSIAWRRPAD